MRIAAPRVLFLVLMVTLATQSASAQTTDCSTPLVASASNSGPYMEGQTVALTANSVDGSTYSWTGPAGFTSSLQTPTIGDASTTNAGTYTVAVSNQCGTASATTTVAVYPQPTISISNVIQKAPAKGMTGTFSFHIMLSNPSTLPVTVDYYTSNQTAYAGKDYIATRGIAVFDPGTTDQIENVTVIGTGSKTQKQFLMNLYEPVNATIALYWGYPIRGTGVIQP